MSIGRFRGGQRAESGVPSGHTGGALLLGKPTPASGCGYGNWRKGNWELAAGSQTPPPDPRALGVSRQGSSD